MHVPYFIVQGLRTGSKRFIQRCGNKRVNIRDLNVKLDSKKRGTIFPFLKKKKIKKEEVLLESEKIPSTSNFKRALDRQKNLKRRRKERESWILDLKI